MTGTRIRRAYAVEQRFVVDDGTAVEVRSWARAELTSDPHGNGPHQDAYLVTTRYLDTPNFDTFFRRGSFGRAKYRVRRYGSEDAVFVERKLRTAATLAKRRVRVPLAAIDEPSAIAAREASWFSRRVTLRRLRPVCLIAYDRVARQLPLGGQVVRLTVDSNLCVAEPDAGSFECAPGLPLFAGHSIVELKYQGHPPAIFKALVERFVMTPQKGSKYRGAIAALGLAPRANTLTEPPS